MSDFLAHSLKEIVQFLVPELKSLFDSTMNEFDSFKDIKKLFSDGKKFPNNSILEAAKNFIPFELVKEFLTTDSEKLFKYPLPQVIARILERTVFTGKYALEISSVVYRQWTLTCRSHEKGMAVVDSSMPYWLKLMIKDYPYVVDGLEIWFAIVSWVKEYLSLYYQNDDAVKSDTEFQAWWKEIRNVGIQGAI